MCVSEGTVMSYISQHCTIMGSTISSTARTATTINPLTRAESTMTASLQLTVGTKCLPPIKCCGDCTEMKAELSEIGAHTHAEIVQRRNPLVHGRVRAGERLSGGPERNRPPPRHF